MYWGCIVGSIVSLRNSCGMRGDRRSIRYPRPLGATLPYASVKCNDLFCLFHLLYLIFVLDLDLHLLWEPCSRLEDGIMWRLTLHVRIWIFSTLELQNSQIHQVNSCGDLRKSQTNPCRFSLRLSNPLYSYTPWLQCEIHQQQTITAKYRVDRWTEIPLAHSTSGKHLIESVGFLLQ